MSFFGIIMYAVCALVVFSVAAQALTYFTSVEYPFVSRFREWILIIYSIAFPVTVPLTFVVIVVWVVIQMLNKVNKEV